MRKKGQANAMILLGVGVILLVVVLGVIFTFIRDNALDLKTTINETLTIASGAGQTANVDLTDVTYFGNTTNNTASGIALQTSVNWTRSGSIIIDQDMFNDDNYNISYKYEPDAYLSAGTSRTLVSTIPVLLVVLVFLFVAGFLALNRG